MNNELNVNNFIGKNTTEKLKKFLISQIDETVVKEILNSFSFDSKEEKKNAYPIFLKDMKNIKNWKRHYKCKEDNV